MESHMPNVQSILVINASQVLEEGQAWAQLSARPASTYPWVSPWAITQVFPLE